MRPRSCASPTPKLGGAIVYAELVIGDSVVGIADEAPSGTPQPEALGGSADRPHAERRGPRRGRRARSSGGAKIVSILVDQFYGRRKGGKSRTRSGTSGSCRPSSRTSRSRRCRCLSRGGGRSRARAAPDTLHVGHVGRASPRPPRRRAAARAGRGAAAPQELTGPIASGRGAWTRRRPSPAPVRAADRAAWRRTSRRPPASWISALRRLGAIPASGQPTSSLPASVRRERSPPSKWTERFISVRRQLKDERREPGRIERLEQDVVIHGLLRARVYSSAPVMRRQQLMLTGMFATLRSSSSPFIPGITTSEQTR